ncbi:MAG TPA: NusG domain II-containing protein [Clostridiales bacterium]|nr:NusG domain II-containing protein [Clostridiales bacterium]
MKRLDVWIILFFVVLAGVLFGVFKKNFQNESTRKYVEITYNGEQIQRFLLDEKKAGEKIPIETELGKNIVEIGEGKVRIVEADCPDQVCVRTGWISNSGQTVVCLPHKLVVEIEGEEESEADAYSY